MGNKTLPTLPDDLLDNIVARMPYPSIYKARALSKSWRTRFSSIASIDDEVEKSRAVWFQKLVMNLSVGWPRGVHFPVCMGREFSIAYSRASQTWVKLPTLSFLPKDRTTKSNAGLSVCIHGSLASRFYFSEESLYVANIFTQSWKALPPRPSAGTFSTFITPILITERAPETYKVILFSVKGVLGDGLGESLSPSHSWSAEIYDSKSDTWTSKDLGGILGREQNGRLGLPVYLNGVLYITMNKDLTHIVTLKVEEDHTSTDLVSQDSGDEYRAAIIPFRFVFDPLAPLLQRAYLSDIYSTLSVMTIDPVICNAKLLIVVRYSNCQDYLHIVKVDPLSRTMSLLSVGPPRALQASKLYTMRPISDGRSIFFQMKKSDGPMLEYNEQDNKWSFFHSGVSSSTTLFPFHVAVNPFSTL